MRAPPDVVSELQSQVRRWARANLDAGALEELGHVPPRMLGELSELGLFSLTLPEEHGGAGFGITDACLVVEELARHDRSVATTVGLHLGLGSRGIVAFARPEVLARWLPRMATGEVIGAFAATEAGAGSDLMSIRTALREDGDGYVLDGEKSYVTNARYAGCYTVLARSGKRSHALVLVPRDAEGLTLGPEEKKLGLRASSTATVRFDGVRVPREHVLGGVEAGLDAAYAVLGWGRTMMAAGCVGTARAAAEATVAHVTTRKQFKRTLSAFPAVQSHLGTMLSMIDVMQALVRRTALALDEGRPAEALSFATKIFASERTFDACDSAIQLHGALGVIEPIGVARLLRDCRVTRIFEGSNDVLLVRLGTLRLASAERLERIGDAVDPSLRDEARRCDSLAESIDAAVAEVRRSLGFAAVTRQGILGALARAEIAHHAILALLLEGGRDEGWRDRLDFALRLLERDAASALAAVPLADPLAAQAARVCARACNPHEFVERPRVQEPS